MAQHSGIETEQENSNLRPGRVPPLNDYSVSTLAWLGDAIYELAVRMMIVEGRHAASGRLHGEAIPFVSAQGQAKGLKHIESSLSKDELAFAYRARNFHTASRSKNASPGDYRKATAVEALLGWLWLRGERERAMELIEMLLWSIENEEAGEAAAETREGSINENESGELMNAMPKEANLRHLPINLDFSVFPELEHFKAIKEGGESS